MSPRRGSWPWVLLVGLLALSLVVAPSSARAASLGATLQLRAAKDRLPADGKSQTTLTVDVAEAGGAPVADGTVVRFTTTLGRLTPTVATVGGSAQTLLTAPYTAGTAIVSAVVGSARQTIQIEFTALRGPRVRSSRTVELTADEVSYSPDRALFTATWNAHLQGPHASIKADSLQYDVASSQAFAHGNVVLTAGKKELRADALSYDMAGGQGRLIRLLPDSAERLIVEGPELDTRPDASLDEALWPIRETGETRTWIKVRRAIIDPDGKLILDHAVVYADKTRLLSLRRHVMSPAPGSPIFSNLLGFSSYGGVSLDYPYYYRASAHRIGSLQLRRNSFVGSEWASGWLLGLNEEYVREGKLQGSYAIDDLLKPTRGMRWEHRQQFAGGLLVTADASTQSYSADDPSYRVASLDFRQPLGAAAATLGLAKTNYIGSSQQLIDVGYTWGSLRVPGGLGLVPSLHLRHSVQDIPELGALIDPVTGEPLTFATGASTRDSAAMGLSLLLPSRRVGAMNLTGLLTSGYAWYFGSGATTPTLGVRLGLDRRFPRAGGYLGLRYDYSSSAAGTTLGVFNTNHNTLSLTGSGKLSGARLSARLSRDLRSGSDYGVLGLQTSLPLGKDLLGHPLWSFGVSHLFSHLETFQYASTRFSLSRSFQRFQASLNFSPQGNGLYYTTHPWITPGGYGYTYSGGKHIWLEFSAVGR